MPAKSNSLIRIFLVLALALACLPMLPVNDCGAPSPSACGCCPIPGAGCCSAVENQTPPQNLPVPDTKSQASWRATLSPLLPLLAVLPPIDELSSSYSQPVSRCAAAGHSRQSVLCVRLV